MSNNLRFVSRIKKIFPFILVALSTVRCISAIPTDTIREDMTLAQAQDLLPFQVCLPTYLPPGVKISDTVRYHDEFGDPNESDITIDFYNAENQDVILTVYERHGPLDRFDLYDDSVRNVSLRELIAWQVGWSKVDSMQSQVRVHYEVYNSNNTELLIVEIQSPNSLRAVQATWKAEEFVVINVYTHMSVEETKRIANSITDCVSYPTAAP